MKLSSVFVGNLGGGRIGGNFSGCFWAHKTRPKVLENILEHLHKTFRKSETNSCFVNFISHKYGSKAIKDVSQGISAELKSGFLGRWLQMAPASLDIGSVPTTPDSNTSAKESPYKLEVSDLQMTTNQEEDIYLSIIRPAPLLQREAVALAWPGVAARCPEIPLNPEEGGAYFLSGLSRSICACRCSSWLTTVGSTPAAFPPSPTSLGQKETEKEEEEEDGTDRERERERGERERER